MLKRFSKTKIIKSLKVLELAQLVNRKAFPTPPERLLVNDNDQGVVEAPRRASPSHVNSAVTELSPNCDPRRPKPDFGGAGKDERPAAELEAPERGHRTA